MNIGMLWFDNDPKSGLDTKIERAANYYREKYGRYPTLCFVHPSMIPQTPNPSGTPNPVKAGGLDVRPTRSVLPNHFWIGVNGVTH
jgi:hypothetical protein